jgi:hypothetical protein
VVKFFEKVLALIKSGEKLVKIGVSENKNVSGRKIG